MPVGVTTFHRGQAYPLDSGGAAQSIYGAFPEPLRPKMLVLGIIEIGANDGDSTDKIQILTEVLLDFLAHGQNGDKAGNPQTDGQGDALKAAPLPNHLAQADGHQVLKPH